MTLLEKGTCSLALFTNLKQNLKFCKFLLMVSLKNFGILFYQHIKTHQRVQSMLKNVGVYLEISLLDCLTTKNSRSFPKFQQNFSTFQGSFQIPRLSRTVENHESSPLTTKPATNTNSLLLYIHKKKRAKKTLPSLFCRVQQKSLS